MVPTGKGASVPHLSERELCREKDLPVGLGDPTFLFISDVVSACLHGLDDVYTGCTKVETCQASP